MILFDSDILLLELRYPNDSRYSVNRQTIQQIQADGTPRGVTLQTLLEVIGKLSFNLASFRIPQLPKFLTGLYRLTVFPTFQPSNDYAGCTIQELIDQMTLKMALGDAVQAVEIARYASFVDCLLSWNAKHFQGKIAVPVQTPEDWLNLRRTNTP